MRAAGAPVGAAQDVVRLVTRAPLASPCAAACFCTVLLLSGAKAQRSANVERASPLTCACSPQVYTDSAYYVDRATAKHLLSFYEKHAPLTCEIDAYGDFLQALGPEATSEVGGLRRSCGGGEKASAAAAAAAFAAAPHARRPCAQYCDNTANVIDVESDLTKMRRALFHHLQGTRLNVVLCNVVRAPEKRRGAVRHESGPGKPPFSFRPDSTEQILSHWHHARVSLPLLHRQGLPVSPAREGTCRLVPIALPCRPASKRLRCISFALLQQRNEAGAARFKHLWRCAAC